MEKRALSANEVRQIAEAVDGIRGERVYVVWGKEGPVVKRALEPGDELIFACETKGDEGRRRFKALKFEPPVVDSTGKEIPDLLNRLDAIFFGDAAIDKFVLPYYIRFKSPEELASIRSALTDRRVYAAAHDPLSDIVLLADVRTPSRGIELLTLAEFEAVRKSGDRPAS